MPGPRGERGGSPPPSSGLLADCSPGGWWFSSGHRCRGYNELDRTPAAINWSRVIPFAWLELASRRTTMCVADQVSAYGRLLTGGPPHHRRKLVGPRLQHAQDGLVR